MLVLSRKVSEVIRIGDSIEVTVVRIGPASVRIGIKAPRELNIVREELMHGPQTDTAEEQIEAAGRVEA